ncbi:MAG TPA: SpoIIE family protein phosphatase [Leptospiraceae bacterium]|nr:SpoIIE family protein phosphatase [Leptospiraceae bacterium]HMY67463.1 SpoIIE family protein phosphatase [Leptospiraceae bacterium]HNF14283.1 SpoIIE family protein phosphatase [Leptospiraceae bacterium]HNF23666.1 SpoIIE family protein phosphatase [Leptospiraceae bacterium]HNI97500.1 SpoIIE family protein phosphatase [Leptospiraceae bacterium]
MIELKYGTRRVISFRGAKKVVGGLTEQNKIHVLLHISKELAKVDREEDLFRAVCSLCKEIFECDNITLRLWNGEKLHPASFIVETVPEKRALLPEEGYSGKTFTEQKSNLIYNLEDTDYIDEGEKTRCVICVPITNREEKLGTISVESNTEFFYKEDDLEILEALGSQLALALTNVRLIEGMMEARKREAVVLSQLEWDLKMGRKVQSQIIQSSIAPWNGINFASFYEPMTEVSGDYFGIVKTGNSLTFISADVSGHGIPAALVTMAIHSYFQRSVAQGMGLPEIMEYLGKSLKPQLPESTYFTAFIIRIHSDYTFSYINGGHQTPLYFEATGETGELDSDGPPLGILDVTKSDYSEKFGKFNSGDALLLLTDGFPEQKNLEREEFSLASMRKIFLDEKYSQLREKGKFNPEESIAGMLKTWNDFKGEAPKGDDLSMILLYCNPSFNKAQTLFRSSKTALKEGDHEKTYELALSAYNEDPSFSDNLLFLAKMYFNDKRYMESCKYLSEYIQTSGEDTAQIHYMLGKALFYAERYEEAKISLRKSISCDHTYVKSNLFLAKCYLKEKAYTKAIRTIERGLKSAPNDEHLLNSLERLNKKYGQGVPK